MKKGGFTLVEVLVAILLVGMAMVSLLAANGVFTQANGAGTDLSTAEFLVEQVKELTAMLPVIDPEDEYTFFGSEEASLANYDDLDDFDDKVFSPPISAGRQPLNDFAAFSQQITVQNVNAGDFEQVTGDHGSNFVRVTVVVSLNSKQIASSSWIRADY
jgi:prepilin-type N-terminal cleavage/methylation domain-containing protein